MTFPLSPDDGRSFFLAVGLGVIVGMIFGGWVMSMLHKLLMVFVKTTLLLAVVAISLVLWKGYQSRHQPSSHPPAQVYSQMTNRSTQKVQTTPVKQSMEGRWWEQH